MCPHSAHRRRCSHQPPAASHSAQPVPLGGTAGSTFSVIVICRLHASLLPERVAGRRGPGLLRRLTSHSQPFLPARLSGHTQVEEVSGHGVLPSLQWPERKPAYHAGNSASEPSTTEAPASVSSPDPNDPVGTPTAVAPPPRPATMSA